MVIAVPIPKEQAGEGQLIEEATTQALNELKNQKINGREVTPFLLKRVNELSGGKSLTASMLTALPPALHRACSSPLRWVVCVCVCADIALIKHNCLVGAKIAVALSELRKQQPLSSYQRPPQS